MASALCCILKFLKLSGLNQIFYIRDQQIIKPGQLSIFINNFYWNTGVHIFYVLPMAAFETFLDSIETFFFLYYLYLVKFPEIDPEIMIFMEVITKMFHGVKSRRQMQNWYQNCKEVKFWVFDKDLQKEIKLNSIENS